MEGIPLEKYTWRIEAFSKNTKKLSSKAFKIGGIRWKIILYPKGKDAEHLSLYMKVAESLPPYGWTRFVFFRLALINQADTNKSILKETQQKFNSGNSGWGSPSFIPLKEFQHPSQGFLVNDTCIIEAHVSVSKAAFNIIPAENLSQSTTTTTHHNESNSNQSPKLKTEPKLKELHEDQASDIVSVTLSPTSTYQSKDDQISEIEVQLLQLEYQKMELSKNNNVIVTYSSSSPNKQLQFVPSAPPMYPPIFNDAEEFHLTPLSDIIDYNSLEPEEEAFIPLWEEVCSWHPSLIENQRKRSPRFILWAFIALGRVLHFLKTKKIRDMGDDENCMHLQVLWDELQSFGFDLTWLEPYVESALGAKAYLERAEQVKNLRGNVSNLEIEMRKLKAKMAVTEVDLEVAIRDLENLQNGFEERDMDAELGYGIP